MLKVPTRTATLAVAGTALLLSGCVTGNDVNTAQTAADQALTQAQAAQQSASAAQYMAQAAQQSADQARSAAFGRRP